MPTFTVQPDASNQARPADDKCVPAFTLKKQGSVLTLRFAGPRVGEREAVLISPHLRTAMAELGTGLKGVVLDMSEVRVMSSFGLGLCIELRNVAMSQRAGTVLYGMCADIRELFRVMKVDRLFTIAASSRDVPK